MEEKKSGAWIGIDVSKDSFEVCFVSEGAIKQYANSSSGIKSMLKAFKNLKSPWLVIESTGGYEQNLLLAAWKAGVVLSYVNPRQTEAFRRSLGTEAKTDKIDARMLALFGERMTPRTTEMPSEKLLNLRALLTRRQQLVQILAMEKTHKSAPIQASQAACSFKSVMKVLKDQIRKLDTEVLTIIDSCNELSAKAAVIRQNKGAGPQLTAQLIANMPELGTLNRKKIAALAGLAPFNRDSGAFAGTRSISGGRREVRTILYMATVAALKCNQKLKAFFLRLVSRGKPKMKALIATMRHFLTMINSQMRDWRKSNPVAFSA